MHIRTVRRPSGNRYITYCSEYAKGKAKQPKCNSPHIIDVDIVMQNLAEVLQRIARFSLENKTEFEELVKRSLAKEQTDEVKKQQKRIPQITHRLEQIEKVLDKLYEDNALGAIDPDRYEQLSQKYSEEYYQLKKELEEAKANLSDYENASQRAKKFIRLVESYCNFEEITPTAINEFISKIVVHERDVKGARYAVQRVEVYFNYIGKFENELTEQLEPTEQECIRMREEIEKAKHEKELAYHRAYNKAYRAKHLEERREYERKKAREYRARKKQQAAISTT